LADNHGKLMDIDMLNESGLSKTGIANAKRKAFKELKLKWTEIGPLNL
jgi:hypothetical protein